MKNKFYKTVLMSMLLLVGGKSQAMMESDSFSEQKHFYATHSAIKYTSPNFSPSYEEELNLGSQVLQAFYIMRNFVSGEICQELAASFLKEANKFSMTDGYQTRELRELSNKNLVSRSNMLKIASILDKNSDAEKLLQDEKESKKYSYSSYDAFLSVDEDAGDKYTLEEEKEIQNFFLSHVNYLEKFDTLTNFISSQYEK